MVVEEEEEEEEEDVFTDVDVNKLLIVTQSRKTDRERHEGHDRTGDFCSRVKISQELAEAINDGLYFYEEDLGRFDDEEDVVSVYYSSVIDSLLM